jgi:3-dehydroquinate dehydratase type I
MICVSLSEPDLASCLAALRGLSFAEIRLDKSHLSLQDVARLFSSHKKLIATCRPGGISDTARKELLLAAIDAGAAYVDVEVDSEAAFREEILTKARQKGCKVIVSFHDAHRTPDREELGARLEACFEAGADIAKVACKAQSDRDNARLLGLLDSSRPAIVIAMGPKGRIVRVMAPLLGSPFTLASPAEGRETAEGQIDRKSLLEMMEAIQHKIGNRKGDRS